MKNYIVLFVLVFVTAFYVQAQDKGSIDENLLNNWRKEFQDDESTKAIRMQYPQTTFRNSP